MNRKETLDRAAECVLKDRQNPHGPPEDSFALVAKFWSTYLGVEIKDYQVPVLLGLLKIARLKFSPDNEDNWVDMAGYAACGAELATKTKEVISSFWSEPSSQMDAIARMLHEADMAKTEESMLHSKNNPCTGTSPSPFPATILSNNTSEQ